MWHWRPESGNSCKARRLFFPSPRLTRKLYFLLLSHGLRESTRGGAWGRHRRSCHRKGTVSDAQKKKTTQRLRFERPSPVTPTAL